MANTTQGLDWHGRTVLDESGGKVGSVEEIYLDDDTGAPEWMLVKTGLFGSKSTFVPMRGAAPQGGDVRVPFSKSQIKDAPNIDADQDLSQAQEAEIYAHYGLAYGESRSESGLPEGGTAGAAGAAAGTGARGGPVGRDVSGPTTDDAMTRSEEELRVGTRREEAGRVRLRKHVVSEPVSETVQTSREEVRVTSEPITDANREAAYDGPAISEEEHEVVLHEETPVVEKAAVPKERVRLDTETVTEEETVSEEVRKERIEVEGDQTRP